MNVKPLQTKYLPYIFILLFREKMEQFRSGLNQAEIKWGIKGVAKRASPNSFLYGMRSFNPVLDPINTW